MIAIVDYGAGNLQSVQKALDFIGAKNRITENAAEIEAASARSATLCKACADPDFWRPFGRRRCPIHLFWGFA